MSASTSLPIASRHIPFLPNELISQILQSPRLPKSDLARCCLVNRRFLSLAQEQLYRTVLLVLMEHRQRNVWDYSEPSRLLVRTLERSVSLSRIVLKLRFMGKWASSTVAGSATRVKCASLARIFEGIFVMLPRVVSLQVDAWIWNSGEVRKTVFQYGYLWETLKVRARTLLRDGKTLRDFPILKELDCDQLPGQPQNAEPIPESLEVLKIMGNRPQTLRGSPNSRLKILHVVGSPETLSHIGNFQELQHLHIFRGLECQPLLPSSAFSSFSHLAHLRSLSLALWSVGDPTLTATLPSLLAHLPPSLDRLDFPERTPLKTLSTYFKLEMSPPFRFLGYSPSKYRDKTEKCLSITAVSVSGWSRGFQVERIGR